MSVQLAASPVDIAPGSFPVDTNQWSTVIQANPKGVCYSVPRLYPLVPFCFYCIMPSSSHGSRDDLLKVVGPWQRNCYETLRENPYILEVGSEYETCAPFSHELQFAKDFLKDYIPSLTLLISPFLWRVHLIQSYWYLTRFTRVFSRATTSYLGR